jgi:hypothetical protein
MPKKKRRDGRILRVSLRAVLGLLGVVLAGNALFVVVPSFKVRARCPLCACLAERKQ